MISDKHGVKCLWMEVLQVAVQDALEGVPGQRHDVAKRIQKIEDARLLLTTPSEDLEIICSLAGLDWDAVLERMKRKIADAPTPTELVQPQYRKRRNQNKTGRKTRTKEDVSGVGQDFRAPIGTGDVSPAQDSTKIDFLELEGVL